MFYITAVVFSEALISLIIVSSTATYTGHSILQHPNCHVFLSLQFSPRTAREPALLLSILVGSSLGFIIMKPLKSVTNAVRMVTREQRFDKFVEYTPIARELDEFVVAYNRMLDVVNEGREGLKVSLDKAYQANKAKDLFLASVGHELITPLNGVVGMLTIAS